MRGKKLTMAIGYGYRRLWWLSPVGKRSFLQQWSVMIISNEYFHISQICLRCCSLSTDQRQQRCKLGNPFDLLDFLFLVCPFCWAHFGGGNAWDADQYRAVVLFHRSIVWLVQQLLHHV